MKKILISSNPWQTRIAVTRDGRLQNIYFSSHSKKDLERSFFKGVVSKVLPGIQTAFVNIGQERAGFLHISEIDREMALQRFGENVEFDEDNVPTSYELLQQARDVGKILKEGDQILVQVSKEPVYEKGAKLTTCFTLPGRFIVLMPNIPRVAISKKIDEREERIRLKDIVRRNLPPTMGCIIRTTSLGRKEKEILKDIEFLVNTWETIQKRFQEAAPEEKIYQDLPLAFQIVRDHLDSDVDTVIIDNRTMQHEIYKFVKTIAPEFAYKIKYYGDHQDIMMRFGVEQQLQDALSRKVSLKSGGSIIIETTQAMTVIDVNTGRYTGKDDLEETILQTNMEAAEEIACQLRLRNIGGLIVIDFIDMASPGNRQKLSKHFEKILRERDKFQSVVLKISEFGLMQITRKRVGKTLLQELTESCHNCHGRGYVRTIQTIAYGLLPALKQELFNVRGSQVTITLNPAIFDWIANKEYNAILDLEQQFNVRITLAEDEAVEPEEYQLISHR
jgi:ribonuclease G